MKNFKTKVVCIITPILLLAFCTIFQAVNIPSTIFIREGKQSIVNGIFKVKLPKGKENNSNLTLLGLLPIRSVSVKAVPNEISVYPGGQPVGIKLSTKGVLVVGLSDISTEAGNTVSPAAEAGIQVGDSILKIDGKEIKSSTDMSEQILKSTGKKMNFTISRKSAIMDIQVKPLKAKEDNSYKVGLWIRDSTAGVGTLTFYDDNTKKFAALGHPITDVDTGTILSIDRGDIVNSNIISIRKGVKGNPGELKGIFMDEDNVLGNISSNTSCGIFGLGHDSLINKKYNKPMKIALRNEIKEGPAKIITTIDGTESKEYDIVIQKLLPQETPGPKSMIIRITDKELLEKTGGIVQGMSGSPIIQNDKLVGAVTHVLINKPDTGYGIYIEWMIRDAGILNKN